MKRQGSIRHQPASAGLGSDAKARRATATFVKQDVAAAIEDMVRNDPTRARQFLELLKNAAESGNRRAVVEVACDFGMLGSVVAEAFRPTPLRTRPARLAGSWATVGRLIGSSMVRHHEQNDARAR